MKEYNWRLRNETKSIYEYVWLDATLPQPTVLPDNPSDVCVQADTVIVGKRTV